MNNGANRDKAKAPLRERVRDAGGWYAYLNSRLIKFAGPAAVGPYEKTPPPTAEMRAKSACPVCGIPIQDHTFDRTGAKTLMFCPKQ